MRDRSFVPLLPGGQLSASEHNRRSQAAAANARMTAPALSVGHAGRMLRTWQKKHTGRVVDGPDHNGAYSLVEIVEQVDPVTGHIAWRDKDGGWQGNPHNLPAFEYNGQVVAPGTHVRFWRSDYAEFLLFKYCCEAVASGASGLSGESGESGHSGSGQILDCQQKIDYLKLISKIDFTAVDWTSGAATNCFSNFIVGTTGAMDFHDSGTQPPLYTGCTPPNFTWWQNGIDVLCNINNVFSPFLVPAKLLVWLELFCCGAENPQYNRPECVCGVFSVCAVSFGNGDIGIPDGQVFCSKGTSVVWCDDLPLDVIVPINTGLFGDEVTHWHLTSS